MEETSQGAGGSSSGAASGDQGKEKDVVAYATYSKTVSEAKKLRDEVAALRAKETEREQSALSEQGKYKEALEAETKRRKDVETKLADKDKTYARQIFTKEAKSVALQMGAKPEALDDIVKVGNWSDIEIDQETFTINQEQLKDSMAKLQKDKPFFFGNTATSPKTVQTGAASRAVGESKTTSKELTKAEILEQLHNLK